MCTWPICRFGDGVSLGLLRVTAFGIHDTLSNVLHAKSWCLRGRLLRAPDAEMGSPWGGARALGEASWKVWTEQLLFQATNKPRDRMTAVRPWPKPSFKSTCGAGGKPGPRKNDFTLPAVTSQPGADRGGRSDAAGEASGWNRNIFSNCCCWWKGEMEFCLNMMLF